MLMLLLKDCVVRLPSKEEMTAAADLSLMRVAAAAAAAMRHGSHFVSFKAEHYAGHVDLAC